MLREKLRTGESVVGERVVVVMTMTGPDMV